MMKQSFSISEGWKERPPYPSHARSSEPDGAVPRGVKVRVVSTRPEAPIGRAQRLSSSVSVREAAKAAPLVEHEETNEVESGLNDLEVLESELPVHDNDIPVYEIDDHNNE